MPDDIAKIAAALATADIITSDDLPTTEEGWKARLTSLFQLSDELRGTKSMVQEVAQRGEAGFHATVNIQVPRSLEVLDLRLEI